MTPNEAALVKVGLEFLHRTAPTGIAFVRHWWKGRKILVVGQSRAGKTTFLDYFQFGLFADEKDTEKTYDVSSSASFSVAMGKGDALKLMVKSVTDVPGQVGAAAHADLAYEHNPHAILVFTDLTTPLTGEEDRASGAWLTEFCARLETRWRAGKKKNRLKCMIVVLNKKDKAKGEMIAKCNKQFQKTLGTLHDAKGAMTNRIEIVPCVLVTNPEDQKLVDGLISHLAKHLQ